MKQINPTLLTILTIFCFVLVVQTARTGTAKSDIILGLLPEKPKSVTENYTDENENDDDDSKDDDLSFITIFPFNSNISGSTGGPYLSEEESILQSNYSDQEITYIAFVVCNSMFPSLSGLSTFQIAASFNDFPLSSPKLDSEVTETATETVTFTDKVTNESGAEKEEKVGMNEKMTPKWNKEVYVLISCCMSSLTCVLLLALTFVNCRPMWAKALHCSSSSPTANDSSAENVEQYQLEKVFKAA